jgi:hypothetical protein
MQQQGSRAMTTVADTELDVSYSNPVALEALEHPGHLPSSPVLILLQANAGLPALRQLGASQ